jgi:hypothetical protein
VRTNAPISSAKLRAIMAREVLYMLGNARLAVSFKPGVVMKEAAN